MGEAALHGRRLKQASRGSALGRPAIVRDLAGLYRGSLMRTTSRLGRRVRSPSAPELTRDKAR
jgi:hypothetical protein